MKPKNSCPSYLAKKLPCKNCKLKTGNHARGLCCRCFRTPEVRDAYPAKRKGGNGRGPDGINWNLVPKPASAPTGHPPGSAEKIAVMQARVAAGEAVFHDDDARPDEDEGLRPRRTPPPARVYHWHHPFPTARDQETPHARRTRT